MTGSRHLVMYIVVFATCLVLVSSTGVENIKDQFCTDPRTMMKHKAYTEWADAYSCTRHRCQPGGRNLAIYTVGCKRVEAPESAIECEEVVEDTNMQFPYCCTRLRCLVVVRGEVWTRVLGQPWETLPAAPWSHMYKMKKPPPADGTFLPKEAGTAGPVYELAEPEHDKTVRSKDKECADCAVAPVQRSASAPDIVIALSTGAESKKPTDISPRHRSRKENSRTEDDIAEHEQRNEIEAEETPVITEKVPDVASEEKFNSFPPTKAPRPSHRSQFERLWTESPLDQPWQYDREKIPETEALKAETPSPEPEDKKPANLQALVDAIGSRMRDIESVVQKMSSRAGGQTLAPDDNVSADVQREIDENVKLPDSDSTAKPKQSNPSGEHYRRLNRSGKWRHRPPCKGATLDGNCTCGWYMFNNRHTKYVHVTDTTTEPPLFVEDTHLNGYFSDPSNNMLRRNGPKEPAATYMAPVNTDTRRSHQQKSESNESKHKKHSHRRKKSKGHHRHHKEEKRRFNKITSVETDRNTISLEDSGNTTN